MEFLHLLVTQARKELGNDMFVLWHYLVEDSAAVLGKKKPVGAALLATFKNAGQLHAVEKLADISLGHQQRIGELLLRRPITGPDVSQHVKLSSTQIPAAKFIRRRALDLLKYPRQAQPGENRSASDAALTGRRRGRLNYSIHYVKFITKL